MIEDGYVCNIAPNTATPSAASACTKTCGNGAFNPFEECDQDLVPGTLANADGCTTNC